MPLLASVFGDSPEPDDLPDVKFVAPKEIALSNDFPGSSPRLDVFESNL